MTASQSFAGTVTTTVDEDNVVPGTGLSLREAIAAAVHGLTIRNGNANGAGSDETGGGIRAEGVLFLSKCTVTANVAAIIAGGIHSEGGAAEATLENCTVSDNHTTDSHSNDAGGIISARSMHLIHCTVSNNSASNPNNPGGILVYGGTLTLENTIVAGNTSGTKPALEKRAGGTIVQNGVNLIGNSTGSTLTASATLLTGNALLASLGDYGGPTACSPAP